MKTNIVLALFLIFMSAAQADKMHLKDRTDCEISGQRINIDISSKNRITSSDDDEYGEHISLQHNGRTINIETKDNGIGRYRLFTASNEICTKPLAIKFGSHDVAIFLSKDNRPFANTVMVLYYNTRTHEADFMASKIQSRSAFSMDGKAYFKLATNDQAEKFGTVVIGKNRYNFIEKTFEPWISFDGKNFRLDRAVTYRLFEHSDLLKQNMLDDLNEFREIKYKIASNPTLKKTCLALHEGDWVCQ